MMYEQAHCRDEAANHQLPIAVAFCIIWIFSVEDFSSLIQNVMQIHYSTGSVILNATATVHMLTQWHLPSPLTSTVKLTLFTHAHYSPLSLAARLHWCLSNCSHYTNNSWTLSRQTSYNFASQAKGLRLRLLSLSRNAVLMAEAGMQIKLNHPNTLIVSTQKLHTSCIFTFHWPKPII